MANNAPMDLCRAYDINDALLAMVEIVAFYTSIVEREAFAHALTNSATYVPGWHDCAFAYRYARAHIMGYYVGRGNKDGICGPPEELDRPRNIVEATFFACHPDLAQVWSFYRNRTKGPYYATLRNYR